jgi:hypothetical protein
MALNKSVCLHFSEDDYEHLREIAELAGKSFGEWSREVLLEQLNGAGQKKTNGAEPIEVALEGLLAQARATARLMADLFNASSQGKLGPEVIRSLWDRHKVLQEKDAEEILRQAVAWKKEVV